MIITYMFFMLSSALKNITADIFSFLFLFFLIKWQKKQNQNVSTKLLTAVKIIEVFGIFELVGLLSLLNQQALCLKVQLLHKLPWS